MTEKAIKTKFNGAGWGYTVTWDSKARARVKRVKTRTYRWQLDPESTIYQEVYGNGRAPGRKPPTRRDSSR